MIDVDGMDSLITALAEANPDLSQAEAEEAMIFIGDTPEFDESNDKVKAEIGGEIRWLEWPWEH